MPSTTPPARPVASDPSSASVATPGSAEDAGRFPEDGTDVVIVGGGIAGSSLATALAGAGRRVLVLEATSEFEDRVRGESMMPWGVAEAARLGVADVLVAAGAHTAPRWLRYAESDAEPREIPVGLTVPGIAGNLNLAHRTACTALLSAAMAAGATAVRGVRNVHVHSGPAPRVEFDHAGGTHVVSPRLVVGADGRGSVVRRNVGIALRSQAETGYVVGLLLDDVEGPDDHDVVAEHDLGLFLLLHQGAGRARAYHVVTPEHRVRYQGTDGPRRFLEDASAVNDVVRQRVRSARPAGPCGSCPGTDTWTDRPFAPGVVLIGDAAGHNDPTAGCGLSIAMRDARIVRDLVLDGDDSTADFEPYGAERIERMRRLRLVADLVNAASIEPGPGRARRRARFAAAMAAYDDQIFPLMLGMFAGPETIPSGLVDDAVLDRLRAE